MAFKMIYSPNKTLHGNFKYYEVFKSSTADRLEIDNIPEGKELDRVLEVAEQTCIHILQPTRDEFGSMSPSSWFRCEALEKEITKVSFENWVYNNGMQAKNPDENWKHYFSLKSHPEGEAVDFEKAGVDNNIMFKWCCDNLPVYDQLIAEFMSTTDGSAGWIHGSHSFDNNRMQIKKAKK